MPSNPTLGGSDLVQSLQKAVPQKLLQGEEKLTTLLSRVLLKDVDRQLYSSNSCISTPVTHSGQWSMGGVSCVTSKWTHEKPKCASVVSLFALSQKMPVPDGACARTSLTTNTCRLWWACVCVCMWMYVYVGISVCVCVCVCMWLRFGGHFFQWQNRVFSDGYKGERRLEKKTESVMWSRYFPGSPLPSVSSSQASPSGLTLLPLLGLVVSQSPFLIDQQLDLSPV